ncbi:hypothetical protein AW03_008760 [Bacillus subtilis HJ5]|nr:hypothetical protein AW03_008760 [Bacillus subtilis HJ5]
MNPVTVRKKHIIAQHDNNKNYSSTSPRWYEPDQVQRVKKLTFPLSPKAGTPSNY